MSSKSKAPSAKTAKGTAGRKVPRTISTVEEFYEETDPLSMLSKAQVALGEKLLMLAVLENAIRAFQKHIKRNKGIVTGRNSPWPWIESTDSDWPFSFENICEQLAINPDYIRFHLRELVKKARANQAFEIRPSMRASGIRQRKIVPKKKH
jgi:hypothetical protein